jgi:hypothetical protein
MSNAQEYRFLTQQHQLLKDIEGEKKEIRDEYLVEGWWTTLSSTNFNPAVSTEL